LFFCCSFGFSRGVNCLVKANVSEKRAVSIFRVSTSQSALRINPKERHHNCRRRQNLISHNYVLSAVPVPCLLSKIQKPLTGCWTQNFLLNLILLKSLTCFKR
jgi:hypothetical protein